MFDNQDTVSAIPQGLQSIDQNAAVPGMQPDGGLVENVAYTRKIGTQLGCKANPLGLSTGKRIATA